MPDICRLATPRLFFSPASQTRLHTQANSGLRLTLPDPRTSVIFSPYMFHLSFFLLP